MPFSSPTTSSINTLTTSTSATPCYPSIYSSWVCLRGSVNISLMPNIVWTICITFFFLFCFSLFFPLAFFYSHSLLFWYYLPLSLSQLHSFFLFQSNFTLFTNLFSCSYLHLPLLYIAHFTLYQSLSFSSLQSFILSVLSHPALEGGKKKKKNGHK